MEIHPLQEAELRFQRCERPLEEHASPLEVPVERFLSRHRLRGKPRQRRDHHRDGENGEPARD